MPPLRGMGLIRFISTHSRAKAAGFGRYVDYRFVLDFNSQPREGGWRHMSRRPCRGRAFQLTAARRRLEKPLAARKNTLLFQLTAARRRLAAVRVQYVNNATISTHSRAKAAGAGLIRAEQRGTISTHSRAKAAGITSRSGSDRLIAISTHSRAKAAGS